MIQVYVLVSFWDENGLHKAGTFTEVKEENFDPYYMQKVESGSVDAYTKEETNALLEAKQDELTAGTNIQISDDDVISAEDVKPYVLTSASSSVKNCITNPNQTIYLIPVAATELDAVVSSGTPIVVKMTDGYLNLNTTFSDGKILGCYTVGYRKTSDGVTTGLKVVGFELVKDSNMYVAIAPSDITPAASGGSVTQITILDSDMGPVNATDITSSSMSNLTIVNYETSEELSYSDIVDLCIAGKVYIKFETSQYAYNEYTYGVIDAFGQPLESSPSVLGLIHFTLIKSTGNANFKNVTLAYGGNNWNSTTW